MPKLKLIVEISQYTQKDNFDTFREFQKKCGDFDNEIIEKNYKDLTIKDLTELVNVAKDCWVMDEVYNELLLFWLQMREIKFEIIHEGDFEKEKYPDFIMLEK